MLIPSDDDLNEMTRALTMGTIGCPVEGLKFRELPVEQRIVIMQLTIAADQNRWSSNIDDSLQNISHWFEKSKLWEGPGYG